MVVSKSNNTMKGTMVLSDCDKDSVSNSKDALSNTLTQKIQSDTSNSNSKVAVNDVRQMSDGTLVLDYECTDVSDQDTAKKTLNTAVKQDDVKQVIIKASKTDAPTSAKPKQQTTNQQSESNFTQNKSIERISNGFSQKTHQFDRSF
jgi:hypothetical protein